LAGLEGLKKVEENVEEEFGGESVRMDLNKVGEMVVFPSQSATHKATKARKGTGNARMPSQGL
jgi:hypothetical protein